MVTYESLTGGMHFAPQKTGESLKKANHSKGWGAKPLAYISIDRDTVAGLPGG
jgi:hypothetical protein